MYIVSDNAFNRSNYPDLIGRVYHTPPSYANVREFEWNELWERYDLVNAFKASHTVEECSLPHTAGDWGISHGFYVYGDYIYYHRSNGVDNRIYLVHSIHPPVFKKV